MTNSRRRKYRKKAAYFVTAVQLDLDTDGFTYRKWGDEQRCKAGDWLVENRGDTYTVDRETFAKTYRFLSPGVFAKTTPIWAEVARESGKIQTKEGATHYQAGDYVVFNSSDGTDGYAIEKAVFEEMYEAADS